MLLAAILQDGARAGMLQLPDPPAPDAGAAAIVARSSAFARSIAWSEPRE
jgi:hypothetical protein